MKHTLAILLASVSVALAPEPDLPGLVFCTTLESEIYDEFKSGRGSDSPMDLLAFCPTEAQWKEMSPWVRSRSNIKPKDYITEAWDCEDMAREWVHWTHRWAVEKFTKGDPYPIATYVVSAVITDGFMDFKLSEPAYHAMGLIRMSTGVWWIYDPMADRRVPLAQALYGEGNIVIRKISW